MWTIIAGLGVSVIMAIIGYLLGKKKNDSDILLNHANSEKSHAEAEKLDTENKLAQVELFDKLNKVLTDQNEKLLKSNEVLIAQNRKLIKHIDALEARIANLEDKIKIQDCEAGC